MPSKGSLLMNEQCELFLWILLGDSVWVYGVIILGCLVVINPLVLLTNRVDFGLFCFIPI